MDFFMAKQILQFESIKSNQAFAAKMKHNYRIGEVKNADPTRLKDNRSIIDLPPNATYNSFFEMKINECPYYNTHKIRKNAVLGYEIMMSYGLKDLPKDFSIDRWAEVSKEWLISEFGRENIASAVLHMDEGISLPLYCTWMKEPHISTQSSSRSRTEGCRQRVTIFRTVQL